jgi:hypothetical protein
MRAFSALAIGFLCITGRGWAEAFQDPLPAIFLGLICAFGAQVSVRF